MPFLYVPSMSLGSLVFGRVCRQRIFGCGLPVALHFRLTVSPTLAVTIGVISVMLGAAEKQITKYRALKAYSLMLNRGRSQNFQNLIFLHIFVALLLEAHIPKGVRLKSS